MDGWIDRRIVRTSTNAPPPHRPLCSKTLDRPFYSVANRVVYSLLITFVRHIFEAAKLVVVVMDHLVVAFVYIRATLFV